VEKSFFRNFQKSCRISAGERMMWESNRKYSGMNPSDQELLKRYVQHGEEAAFSLLVQRHGGLIYANAWRKTGNHALAEEITQNTFALLAQKGASLMDHPALLAWMQKAVQYQASRSHAKERNRSRLLENYRQSLTMDAFPDAPDADPNLPLVDEALAELPESDRQILLLRYWRQEPYKAIAQTLGGTVEACEKRVSRALEKMGRFLRRRGVALSVTAISSAMTQGTAKAAIPVHFASILTPTALQATPLMAGWQKLIFLTAMKTKLPLFAAALLLFSAAGVTGFVAGNNWSGTRSNAGSGTKSTPQAKPTGNSQPGSPAGVANLLTDAKRVSLAALLAQIRDVLRRGKMDSTASDLAAAKASQIAPADISIALEMIRKDPGLETDAALVSVLLSAWAKHDGAAACEFTLKLKGPRLSIHPIREPLKVWAARDPKAALAWFRGRSQSGNPADPQQVGDWVPISNIRWILGEWGLLDPKGAAEAISNLKGKNELHAAMVGLGEGAARMQDRLLILDAIRNRWDATEASSRWMEMRTMLERWAQVNPEELAGWLDKQEIPKSDDNLAASPVLREWLQKDGEAAVSWWMSRAGGYPEISHKRRNLMAAWADVDPFAAAEWLSKQPREKDLDSATAELAGKLAQSDPERAFQWAKTIEAEYVRREVLANSFKAWHKTEAAAAEAALRDSALPDAEKQAVLEALKPKVTPGAIEPL
jgi:RNA polymerase sigma factor (sigma-70 family)